MVLRKHKSESVLGVKFLYSRDLSHIGILEAEDKK